MAQDYFKNFKHKHDQYLSKFKDKNDVVGCEVGVAEGNATKFYLNEILTGENCHMFAVDLHNYDGFEENTSGHKDRLTYVKGYSNETLRTLSYNGKTKDFLDFVYIDGGHQSKNTLFDACLTWDLLKVGGIMIFDDLTWGKKHPPHYRPYDGIVSFLHGMVDHYKHLETYLDWQVFIEKLEAPYSY